MNGEKTAQDGNAKEPSSSSNGGVTKDALKSLSTQLSESCLKSSARVLILLSLALNSKLGFVDLLNLTGTGKGSLSNHLEKLEASGYIRTKSVMTFGGPRMVAEITEKGLETFNGLLTSLKKLGK